ncbi:Nucleoside-diphosphate-sugar epimerase [Tranquillimonas rosea]|uniref:Nucleoside-diphosphate-sugar epimerase n=1 Tax=Tranquillimonas rosea TaxID=641238 RepID=A0A1H9RCM3_9RHOB|nr:NAD(P)-dependent oxidoreductase [Tranquillimonas rosea]SER70295.1 Nucleoside-diphosphate-sugar epimerase [Tranquillimonas rosea]
MRVAVTGASGLVGHPVAAGLLRRGHEVTTLCRAPVPLPGAGHRAYTLGDRPDLSGIDALVHAAFSHVPGKYRGGEGDDPQGFLRSNLDGSLALFDAARQASVPHVVFLSSRAVYGPNPPGTSLHEEMTPRPDTLYGEVKLAAEEALAAMAADFESAVSLRATGVYGPPPPARAHKWADLFKAFARGDEVAPRAGTEVHADDLCAAIDRVLGARDRPAPLYNVSAFVLDRHDLLACYARIAGLSIAPPPRADTTSLNAMSTQRLRQLGWQPRGAETLKRDLRAML